MISVIWLMGIGRWSEDVVWFLTTMYNVYFLNVSNVSDLLSNINIFIYQTLIAWYPLVYKHAVSSFCSDFQWR